MAPKRERDNVDTTSPGAKRKRTGFRVGPANLPDGTYRRKAQKIKRNLIEKAKIRASYAKIKSQEPQLDHPPSLHLLGSHTYDQRHDHEDTATEESIPIPASTEPHPSRQEQISSQAENPDDGNSTTDEERDDRRETYTNRRQRFKRPKPMPFAKEASRAQQAKEAAAKRREEIAASRAERERKLEDRERWRRVMEKSKRPGQDGKAKLGRQSKLLLEKVKNMVAEG